MYRRSICTGVIPLLILEWQNNTIVAYLPKSMSVCPTIYAIDREGNTANIQHVSLPCFCCRLMTLSEQVFGQRLNSFDFLISNSTDCMYVVMSGDSNTSKEGPTSLMGRVSMTLD